jgi:hypothetical protein
MEFHWSSAAESAAIAAAKAWSSSEALARGESAAVIAPSSAEARSSAPECALVFEIVHMLVFS